MLKLKLGPAILLKDVLNKALSEVTIDSPSGLFTSDPIHEENRKVLIYNGRNSLREFGVILLGCEEARDILNLRFDFIDVN